MKIIKTKHLLVEPRVHPKPHQGTETQDPTLAPTDDAEMLNASLLHEGDREFVEVLWRVNE